MTEKKETVAPLPDAQIREPLSDAQIREPLFDFLEAFYGKIRILEEKNTGASRADVIGVVDGFLLGFEIKSDRDSYARLKTQTADYDALCDYNYLVIGHSHLLHAHEHIPGHWGIIVAQQTEDGVQLYIDQLPARNTGASLYNQLAFLWRPELEMLLAKNGFHLYRGKSKEFVRLYLLEKVDEETLKRQITDALFERDYAQLLGEIDAVCRERRAARSLRAAASGGRKKTGTKRRKRLGRSTHKKGC